MRMGRSSCVCAGTALLLVAACATPSHVNSGFAALKRGDNPTAEAEFKAALQEKPNDPYALLNLAAVYENTGRSEEAVPLFKQVILVGKDIYPRRVTQKREANKSLADIAADDLSRIPGAT